MPKPHDDPSLAIAVEMMQKAAWSLCDYANRCDSDDQFAAFCRSTAKSLRKRADKIIPPDDEFEKLGNVVPFERQKA